MFKRLDKVQNNKVWRLVPVLLAELIGTFALVFMLIAPQALDLAQFEWYNEVFGTFLMQAFWMAGSVLILVLLFGWVSADLNPAITLAKMATGKTSKQQGGWIIFIQIVAAIAASYVAYYIGANVLATPVTSSDMGAVFPVLRFSANEASWIDLSSITSTVNGVDNVSVLFPAVFSGVDGVFNLWGSSLGFGTDSTAWAFLVITLLLEMVFTWLLLWSVLGAKKVNKNARPFFVFFVLLIVLALGMHTNNIALNPARLVGPALVSQFVGKATTLQYTLVFLFGELLAVLLVARKAGKREYKAALREYKTALNGEVSPVATSKANKVVSTTASDSSDSSDAFKAEINVAVLGIRNDLEVTKGRYKWVLSGKDPIESMNKDQLVEAIKSVKADKYIDLKLGEKELKNQFSMLLSLGEKGFVSSKKELAIAIAKLEKAEEEAAATKEAKKATKAKKEAKKEDKKEESKDDKEVKPEAAKAEDKKDSEKEKKSK